MSRVSSIDGRSNKQRKIRCFCYIAGRPIIAYRPSVPPQSEPPDAMRANQGTCMENASLGLNYPVMGATCVDTCFAG